MKMSRCPSWFASPTATLRADEPTGIGDPSARLKPPCPSPSRIWTWPLSGSGGEPQHVPHARMISRFPSWLLSAMTGSPAIGPTLIGEPEAILNEGGIAAFGSRSLTARTVVDTNARRIIDAMLNPFMFHLSQKRFVHLIRLDGEWIRFLPLFVSYWLEEERKRKKTE